jgi:hypothetical protein
MKQFHAGQDVEIWSGFGVLRGGPRGSAVWRKAKIVYPREFDGITYRYLVQFPDGMRGVSDAAHIRAVETIDDLRLGHSGEIGADP